MRLSNLSIVSIAAYISATLADSTETAPATSIVLCNPLLAATCSPDPALATSISDDFKQSSENYIPYRYPSGITYGDDGLSLTLAKRFDNPSLVSDFYMMFGKVEVWLKSAPGTGIISSFYLQSDDLDEIDLEWFGGDISQMQSNFFSKGDTTTYDRGEYHDMADPRADFHNYTLDWNEDSLSWYVDGALVRTLLKDSPSGFPQSPMRIYFGIWAGGDPTNEPGTIEWAGGSTDYSQAPFAMHIKSLIASDYSTGTEYSYDGTSGTWESIVAKDGEVNGRKAIAMAEFASLVNGNGIDQNEKEILSASSSASSTIASTSSSIAASSIINTPSTTSTPSTTAQSSTEVSTTSTEPSTTAVSTQAQKSSTHEEEHTSTTSSEEEKETTTSHSTSKTVSLKDEFLSSSTLQSKTKTHSEEHTTKHSSTSSESTTASIHTTDNGAAANSVSGLFASLMFLVSLF